MKIQTVYMTSKGVFWNKSEAEKKVNRSKVYSSRPGEGAELEPVVESFALVEDGYPPFLLKEVTIN